MASNFYNLNGFMVGVDIHKYIAFPMVPDPVHPHLVYTPFRWPTPTPHKIGWTVTMSGSRCLRGGFSNALVNHCPIPLPPPSPAELPWLALVVMNSGTKAQLTAHKVTHKGDALAVCIKWMFGANINCSEPFDLPTNQVFNINSVETQPTLGDYIGAIAGYILDAALGWASGKAGAGLTDKEALRSLLKWALRVAPEPVKEFVKPAADLVDPPGRMQDFVQKLVDREKTTLPFLPPFLPPISV